MFSHINSCSPRFQQQLNYMESQFPQPGESISFYQTNPEFFTHQHEFQKNQLYPGTASSSRFSEYGKARLQEAGIEESEAVDELLQILVECLRKADVRTREILLQKFFFEIEKETPLEGFLAERIKHSKLNLLIESFNKISPDGFVNKDIHNCETSEVEGSSSGEKKLERFKIKTVQVGELVKEKSK